MSAERHEVEGIPRHNKSKSRRNLRPVKIETWPNYARTGHQDGLIDN
jgi:hypothetical protein